MSEPITLTYAVPGDDFTRAGEASSDVKKKLKAIGLDPEVIRKVAIAMYEGEINMVIHAGGGEIKVILSSSSVRMLLSDHGPGIPDISLAMQEGYSTAQDEVRNLGFGAGMGLPNMKKYSDRMEITTEIGKGTTVEMEVYIKKVHEVS